MKTKIGFINKSVAVFFTLIFTTSVYAEGKWYKFEGSVYNLKDRSVDKALESNYLQGVAEYVIYIDQGFQGFYLNRDLRINPRDENNSSGSWKRNYLADYACGNALNLGYYNYQYYLATVDEKLYQQKTYVNVGARLDVEAQLLLSDWYIGMPAEGKDFYLGGKNWALSSLTLTEILTENPCD